MRYNLYLSEAEYIESSNEISAPKMKGYTYLSGLPSAVIALSVFGRLNVSVAILPEMCVVSVLMISS